ncbi:hypothetical protein PR202_gb05123 [Eleusine coracana subsp. coracana]|uniref:Uncharacterized protein n=1 Tax=Eleusine coracana subsp. coracana TaxID=191504 RepID=A0AAV5E687_ELECO|nr:hypothetical protein PR202_gb05123 [Eleusine coracana subsp. coracana]
MHRYINDTQAQDPSDYGPGRTVQGKAEKPHKSIQPEKTPDADERIPTAEGTEGAMRLPHAADLRAFLAAAAVGHLSSSSSPAASRASARAPRPPPLRLRAFSSSHSWGLRPRLPPRPRRLSRLRALPQPQQQPPATTSRGQRSPPSALPTSCTTRPCRAPSGGSRSGATARRPRCVLLAAVAPKRNHPLMLLSGVATNAVGFDLSPGASFARHMSMQGFDTWIVEVRGAGLSMRGSGLAAANTKSAMSPKSDLDESSPDKVNVVVPTEVMSTQPQVYEVPVIQDKNTVVNGTSEEPQLVTKLSNALAQLSETFSGYVKDSQLKTIADSFFDRVSELAPDASLTSLEEISENILGLVELPRTSVITDQISSLSQRLVRILGEGQQNVSPRLFGWQERLSATIEDLQKQLELIISYDWDFEHYLEEDVPAAVYGLYKKAEHTKGWKVACHWPFYGRNPIVCNGFKVWYVLSR